MRRLGSLLLVAALGPWACVDGAGPAVDPLPLTRLTTDRTYFKDAYGRYAFFHGVNLSGSTKVPAAISPDGVPTYVGKPFALDDAERHFGLLRAAGIDTVRLLVIWEGVEPTARGVYDQAYLDYLRQVVEEAGRQGIWVLMDMHQDMFSRHLVVRYNHHPRHGLPGSLENMLLALVPDPVSGQYDDSVQGDGAPRWAVQACLPEKRMDSPRWGTPRILSGLSLAELENIFDLYQKLTGGQDEFEDAAWVGDFLVGLPGQFPVEETSDLLPFTIWGANYILSLDLARCFACLLAGQTAFPGLQVEGLSVEDYLQGAYADAWAQVAARVADLPNVIGYDIINEPGGNFLVLTAVAGMLQAGVVDGARGALVGLLGEETGDQLYRALVDLRVLPPDTEPETLSRWGLAGLDTLALLDLNLGFDDKHLRPFYERVGQAIQAVDPDAVLFIESSMSADTLFGSGAGGIGGQFEQPMQRPAGIDQLAFAPHWYPDIYPLIGFNMPPRSFEAEQVRYRDYRPGLEEAASLATYSLGNPPVVFGEFGTYFNFNGIERSRADDYRVSAHVLDNYYEAFESMFLSRIQWCYSPENDYALGDLWNHEDFSILGPYDPRAAEVPWRAPAAWRRPHARLLAGKPIATHYLSPLHYYDPDKGEVDRVGEFEVVYAGKETGAPSEIVVPDGVYPDGFYVWVSDGHCHFDPERRVLYHQPSLDEPGLEHWVRILGPVAGHEMRGWRYFFQDGRVLTR
jgi:hypothetical protein